MTILTKTTDKKKLLPIPTAPLASAPRPSAEDAEAAAMLHARHRARTTTLLVSLIAVLVLLMGIFAGVCFYRQYLREKIQRLNCFIPYSDDVDREENFWVNTQWRDGPTFSDSLKMVKADDDDDDGFSDDEAEGLRNVLKQMLERFQREFNDPMKEIRSMESEISSLDSDTIQRKWFREEVEVKDDDSDSYADIKIPDFKEGRQGRFIHDYKNNLTTIVDVSANRCFIYPLDYETTLPPQSIADVFVKMQSGYYLPDTSVLRKKMRVMLPELERDDDFISERTLQVCDNMKIYRLEPIVSGVYKRSVEPELNEHGKFAMYAGKGIFEADLMNLKEVEEYEKRIH